ncbi:hypothetical protein FF38_07757 [Lucilia cuprina]|uniref:Chitin-binding type-2 domain-containing protein n=1 Tax=Lucilia cuprina TaxID=7375 RepID=A0A0L0CKQ9_LUCCU|nr:hypothetical protein FF38_07757 [Lucilia cuprina]
MKCIIVILMVSYLSLEVFTLNLISFGRSQIEPRETSTCEGRQSPGPICESCDLLSTCVKHSNGWVNIPVETCDTQNGFYCNARLGSCSNATGPCHPFSFEGNFPCTSHGVFPDPYDCQKYHMCYFVGPTLVSASVDCGSDKAFNPATGQCSLTITHPVCHEKQFKCENAGDAHAWPMSPNIFYICKATSNQDERVLYPTLYRCDDGEIFDGYFCRADNAREPNATTKPIIPATSTLPPSVVVPTTIAPVLPRVCSDVGLFADTQDCRKYYYCSAISGNLKQMECPVGTYFNEATSSCAFGSC